MSRLRLMVEIRDPDTGEWHVTWPSGLPDRVKEKEGLSSRQADAYAADLTAPVTGYEHLGSVPHPELCRMIRGHGVPTTDVRVVVFRRWSWRRYEP